MQTFHRSTLVLIIAMGVLLSSCNLFNPDGGDPGNVDQDKELQKLAGVWYRVKSNNPSNDGLELTVINDNGTITANPRGGFDIGDVKWKDLVATEEDQFSYDELGSDGLYYDADLLLDGDTARITIQSSGAGNVQKWVIQSAYTEPKATTTTLDCSGISSATTWENTDAEIDYIVPSGCVIDITAPLTIAAGTVIQFSENSGLGVYDNGSIKAIGTASQPIELKGLSASAGYWRGIHIETNTLDNQFDFVQISDAGSNYVYCCNAVASVFLKGAKMSIKNSQISNGGGIGLRADGNSDLREYSQNTITTHESYPLSLDVERLGELDGTGSSYTGNDEDYAYVYNSDVNANTTISKLNVPYLFEGNVVDVTANLVIEAGADIVFEENGGIGVFDNGTLDIQGASGSEVQLRGKSAVKGYWRGIHTESNSTTNSINYAIISDAGSDYVYCCNTVASIFLKDGKMSIENTEIKNGGNYGIATKADFEFSGYANNTITTHTSNPLYIATWQAGSLDGENSDYTGNDKDFILFYRDQMDVATTMKKNNVPFRVPNNVVLDITEALTLEPGVEFVFEENGGMGIYNNGSLNAEGTATNRVKFEGSENLTGYWRGIHSETTSSKNILDYVDIRNAGSNYVYCCNASAGLFLKSGTMTVTNSDISDNDNCGIFTNSNATLTESNNTFSNNSGGNICN
ncbi:MAG: right-handed parallel beta-helix repeat-containing protein [Bacteroidia bacterium]|nr:right-handed parallel beta-helix repeat-containing protein [Bacteroidia bacterium]